MISVFVLEDEMHVMESTMAVLNEFPVNVVGSATNIEGAYLGIQKTKPQLVLFDVEIGSRKSFELLERFETIDFKVVFITAHQKYALEAFRFSALDFLLKPISMSAMELTLKKAADLIVSDQNQSINALQHNLKSSNDEQKLILKTLDKIHVLKLMDIIHCESDQSYTHFYTINEKIMVSKTLGYYDDLLSSHGFFRVHKSHLINLKHVVQIHKGDGGEVEMSDTSRVSISQRKRDEFLQKIDMLGLQ